ncbi:MAG: biotin/lipoyl-binding protein, partial [Sphingopyxis sp.]|nr:biotin/lipoyl-binding protein [Sphingopyxis sp.]
MRVALVTLGMVSALSACADGEQRSALPPIPVTASGRIDSATEARFLIAERDGVIKNVHVRNGDRVERGDPLVTLSCAAERAMAEAAQADARAMRAAQSLIDQGARAEDRASAVARLDEAAAVARDAQAAVMRAEPLAARGFVSTSQLDSLRARAAATAAAATAAQAQLALLANGPRVAERQNGAARAEEAAARAAAATAEADRCTLRAPIAGTVARVMRRSGEASGA